MRLSSERDASFCAGAHLLAVAMMASMASTCRSQELRVHYVEQQQVFDHGMRGEDWCVTGDLLAHDGLVVMEAIDQALATATRVLCRAIRKEDDDFASQVLFGAGLRPLSQPLPRAIEDAVYERVRQSSDSGRSVVAGLLAMFEQAHGPAAAERQGVLQRALDKASVPDASLLLPAARDYLAGWDFPQPGIAMSLLEGRQSARSAIEHARSGVAADRDSVRSDLWRLIIACEAAAGGAPVREVATLDAEVRTQNLLGLVLLMRALQRHDLCTLGDVGVSALGGRRAQRIYCRIDEGELGALVSLSVRAGRFLEAYKAWVAACLEHNPGSSEYEDHLRDAGDVMDRRLVGLRAHIKSVTQLRQECMRRKADHYTASASDPLFEALRRWQVGGLGLMGSSVDSALTGSRDRASHPFRESVGMPYAAGAVLVSGGQSTARRYVLPVYLPGSQSTLLEVWAGVRATPRGSESPLPAERPR